MLGRGADRVDRGRHSGQARSTVGRRHRDAGLVGDFAYGIYETGCNFRAADVHADEAWV